MTETINFTKDERNDIAEFVYSNEHDILIKPDALKLIEVLNNHNIIKQPKYYIDGVNNQKTGIVEELMKLLQSNITVDQITEIMDDYYKGV